MLTGGLIGLAVGGVLTELALWAPFVLAAVGMPLLAWPTVRRLAVTEPGPPERRRPRPLRFYATALIRPGVRALLGAEILWVIGYAALPVFFILYAGDVLGLEPGPASLWVAAFALGAGVAMIAGGFVRNPRAHKPFLALGMGLMGAGFLAAAGSTSLAPTPPPSRSRWRDGRSRSAEATAPSFSSAGRQPSPRWYHWLSLRARGQGQI